VSELNIRFGTEDTVPAFPKHDHLNTQRHLMMQDMMGSGMMWGMGFLWLLLAVLLILGIAALAKYVFFR